MKSLVRRIVDHIVRALPPGVCYSLAIRTIARLDDDQSRRVLSLAADVHRTHLQAELTRLTNGVVQDGPFRGLVLPDLSSWGDGDYLPKLLGFYESELHDLFDAATREYDRFIEVGCAEGFYAVGFAVMNPQAKVFAFDSSPEARRVCALAANINSVADRVTIGGHVDPQTLQLLLSAGGKPLLFLDCEGCEFALLDPAVVPALSGTDFVAECHDFAVPHMATVLCERFAKTHDVVRIIEGGRDPNRSRLLRTRNSLIRWLAVNERRPFTMEWVHGRACTDRN